MAALSLTDRMKLRNDFVVEAHLLNGLFFGALFMLTWATGMFYGSITGDTFTGTFTEQVLLFIGGLACFSVAAMCVVHALSTVRNLRSMQAQLDA